MKQKYSYRVSIAIDEGRAGMIIASLDQAGQITNKSCLRVLSYSLKGIVRFRVFISAHHYKLFIKLHAAPIPLRHYFDILLKVEHHLYLVEYGSVKLVELEEPLILSVVVVELMPPRSRTSGWSPGKLQHRWPALSCCRVMVMELLVI